MLKIVSLFFLVMMQLCLSVSHSAQKEEVSEGQRHKLPMQRFMVYVEKPGDYSLDILVKRKYPYGKDLNAEDTLSHDEEEKNIRDFIKKLSGVIVVYDLSAKKKILEYNLPFSIENTNGFCCSQFYWGGEELWEGLTLSGGKVKSVGNYMIYSELYTADKRYDEYVLTFIAAHGFK
ncbi:hypothetical protein [Scandinavium lactucae]|uniref:Uncharacterized protein n=1 Tax=Scandinavium lactucae TaxID=3095028 RepID=A0ABU4QL66_9ENTR|nr:MULTISPECIES: hypothetical protein [unclassified Scandinavium]MDX6038894.1 hypothetical protein [Scandinavium sp. V105_6]MDX6049150.1 hypothetical protein [Scandinavium sp. V105_1]